MKPEPLSGTWDEEQGGRHGEDDPAGGLVHLEAAGSRGWAGCCRCRCRLPLH